MSVATSVPVHTCQAAFSDFSVFVLIGIIWTFTYKKRMRNVSRSVAAVAILLFLPSTSTVSFLSIFYTKDSLAHGPIHYLYEKGLVKYCDTSQGSPVTLFADIKQEMHIVKSAVNVMQTLLGDGINFSSGPSLNPSELIENSFLIKIHRSL
jgi:hypothetical protein